MADKRTSGNRRQSSRLQGRAPASIQVNRVTEWNVAIPLLSPLVQSPTSPPRCHNLTVEIKPVVETSSEKKEKQPGPTPSFKKWQHPAAPFCYEPAPLVPFVCAAPARARARCGVDR